MIYIWKEYEQKKGDAYETTIPRNRDPTLSSLIRPRRASFFPEQRRGSQWLKSYSEVDSRIKKNVKRICTYPHRYWDLYSNLWNLVYRSAYQTNTSWLELETYQSQKMMNLFRPRRRQHFPVDPEMTETKRRQISHWSVPFSIFRVLCLYPVYEKILPDPQSVSCPWIDWRSYRGNPWTCLEVADSIVQVAAMFATLVRCSKASRKPLTPKRGNKDYYKGMIGSGLLRSWN